MFTVYHLISFLVAFQSACDSVIAKVECFYGDAPSHGKYKSTRGVCHHSLFILFMYYSRTLVDIYLFPCI